jgi:hypothetical protein
LREERNGQLSVTKSKAIRAQRIAVKAATAAATADALQRIQPDLRFDTVDILRAFDVNRARKLPPRSTPEDARGLTILTSMMFENCLYFRF